MPRSHGHVIVGGGLAGARAAAALREEGFEGEVVLVAAEPELPYERPPLSKAFLAGSAAREETLALPADAYERLGIRLLTGTRATEVDTAAHRVRLGDGTTLPYDRLLLATGAQPRRPSLTGLEREGVHLLRTLADAEALREDLRRGGPVAVLGAGWIGCEVAATARGYGAEVTLLDHGPAPLHRVLGPELGAVFAGLHAAHGVEIVAGAEVTAVAGGARVEAVRLADGRSIACDTLVVGVGVAPDTALAEAAGLHVDNGIVVDELGRTSARDVFAAGDVANALHPRYGRHVRVEHWANAQNQGPAVARSMLDEGRPYDRLPYFFSDQYDTGLEYAGLHGPADRVTIEGDVEAPSLTALWHDEAGWPTAGMHVNRWDDGIEPIKRGLEAVRAPANPWAV
jgi:3-phenylpropionate/trans-cinnamate dioxygenase ferredoxin reductase component